MKDIKVISNSKQSYRGGEIDFRLDKFKKQEDVDLMPQPRRPMATSIANKHLKEKLGDDYETRPYDNYLGSK